MFSCCIHLLNVETFLLSTHCKKISLCFKRKPILTPKGNLFCILAYHRSLNTLSRGRVVALSRCLLSVVSCHVVRIVALPHCRIVAIFLGDG